jgi:hypothetical protein
MFCSQCGCSLLINAKFCHVCGQDSSVNEKPSASVDCDTGRTVIPTSTKATTPASTSQSRTPVSFNEYRQRKEKERSSRFKPKAKKAKIEKKGNEKTPSEVKINVDVCADVGRQL